MKNKNTTLIDTPNKKLFNNLSTLPDTVQKHVKNNIYQLYYQLKFNTIILDCSSFDNSVASFCMEFNNTVKVFIYIDDLTNEENIKYILEYSKYLYFLVDKKCKYSEIFSRLIVVEPNLINKNLYDQAISNKKNKNNCISCFMDKIDKVPNQIGKLLYPNSKVKIRLYNNTNIKHVQNLGMITEYDKWNILIESEFFLNTNDEYLTEASLCGCKIIDMNSISDDLSSAIILPNNEEYTTYEDLLEQCQKI